MSGHGTPRPVDLLLDGVDWQPLPAVDGIDASEPWATHKGVLRIGDIDLIVYTLSDGRRLIEAESMERFFGV